MAVSVVNVVKSKGVVSYLEVGDQLVRQLLTSKTSGAKGEYGLKILRHRKFTCLFRRGVFRREERSSPGV